MSIFSKIFGGISRKAAEEAKRKQELEKAYEELKPWMKKYHEAKTPEDRMMALMDIYGRFDKRIPQVKDFVLHHGEKLLEID